MWMVRRKKVSKNKVYILALALVASLPLMVDYNIVGTDLLLYFTKIEELFGFSPDASYRWFLFLVNLATAGIAFLSFEKCFCNAEVGLLASALYTLAPYRLTLVYRCSAIGEYIAMIFLPLVVWGACGAMNFERREKRYLWNGIILIVGLAGAVLPYVMTSGIRATAERSMLKAGFAGVGSLMLLCVLLWFGLELAYGNAGVTKAQKSERRIANLAFLGGCVLLVVGGEFTGIAIVCILITVGIMGLWLEREERSILPGNAVLLLLAAVALVCGTYQVNQILLTSANIR